MGAKRFPVVGDKIFSLFESDWLDNTDEDEDGELFRMSQDDVDAWRGSESFVAAEVRNVDEESGRAEVLNKWESLWHQAYWSELCEAFVYELDVSGPEQVERIDP